MKYNQKIMKTVLYITLILGFIFGIKKMYLDIHDCENFSVKSNLLYHSIIFKKGKVNFSVTQQKKGFNFFVNSNFFTKNANAVGGLIIDGQTVNQQIPIGGSFIVKNGIPSIKFGRAKKCDYLSQSVVWAIKKGELNMTIAQETKQEEKTHRLLIGTTQNGEVVVVHSNPMVLVTITQIIKFADSIGVTNAIILDSGSSVDLSLSTEDYTHTMKTIPSFVKSCIGIDEPVAYIAGTFN